MKTIYNKVDVYSWLKRADDDLKWAKSSLRGDFYPQTCFVAQQVAEKSLKALIFSLQEDFDSRDISKLRTHNLLDLVEYIQKLKFMFPEKANNNCQVLNEYYVPTRYPDANQPEKIYKKGTAEEAIQIAQEILEFVKSEIP